ncbi:hypothetical protein [Sphingobium sp. CCH11-B1]|jgi:hypothetical protein|uniref:hypothetical protein n=1 Tax=Sphingobium sp. CCH11-B1 TaxID=1768781 RepID=UPI000AEB31D1|nr:hypothetical protein [Sphingobium sp. CCH11-B1]MEA3388150.1 hypothetical protein [Pseudomonadota bacterium]
MQDSRHQRGLFDRWRTRLAQALLREPSIVLIDRDADLVRDAAIQDRDDRPAWEKMH